MTERQRSRASNDGHVLAASPVSASIRCVTAPRRSGRWSSTCPRVRPRRQRVPHPPRSTTSTDDVARACLSVDISSVIAGLATTALAKCDRRRSRSDGDCAKTDQPKWREARSGGTTLTRRWCTDRNDRHGRTGASWCVRRSLVPLLRDRVSCARGRRGRGHGNDGRGRGRCRRRARASSWSWP